jgi:hypothetical protein
LKVLPALLLPILVLLLLRAPWLLVSLPLALLQLFCKRSKSMMGYDPETQKFRVFSISRRMLKDNSTMFREGFV